MTMTRGVISTAIVTAAAALLTSCAGQAAPATMDEAPAAAMPVLLEPAATQVKESISVATAVPVEPAPQLAAAPAWDLLVSGASTDAAGLAAAEAGRVGAPALVFFDAEWCHVCEAIRPDVAALATQFQDRAAVIHMDIDAPESREAMERYAVQGTPTFVVLAADGTVLERVAGWPGTDRLVAALEGTAAANQQCR